MIKMITCLTMLLQTKSGIGGDYHYLPVVDSQSAKLTFESSLIKKTIRKPILKKTFALKKIGYKVIPYEDEVRF